MKPEVTGLKYDKIAALWHEQHDSSKYGVSQLERALKFCTTKTRALDVGCGCGGRFIRLLRGEGFGITGIDISKEMIKLAKSLHPECSFFHKDICEFDWETPFDLIYAWDSIFHLPLDNHVKVVEKLASLLNPDGVLLYTFGDAVGEHTDIWHNDEFYYSSIGINKNVELLMSLGLKPVHLELDQLPFNHVTVIAKK
jgi:trans-aconitate methyltransferase